MRILHVVLGLPPFRRGGMSYYVRDLMKAQLRQGHDIQLLYPGRFRIRRGVYILQRVHPEFVVFEIVNPLPVPIPYGIREPRAFMKPANQDVFLEYLKKTSPDIIHVHTIMGIHREFFQAAKTLRIKPVFTTHDYFGLCLKTNFINAQQQLCSTRDSAECGVCCAGAGVPTGLAYFMQSALYQKIKNCWPMKNIRAYKKKTISTPKAIKPSATNAVPAKKIAEYERLYSYYESIFEMIEQFHFNSRQSKEMYECFLDIQGEIIHLTHEDIKDHRALHFSQSKTGILRIGYIGNVRPYKGITVLIEALHLLAERGFHTWEAHLYGDDYTEFAKSFHGKVVSHGRYERRKLENVFQSMDLLVVPSIWKETFGIVVLEALSYGLPVFVSENVGAKDLLLGAPIFTRFKPCVEELFAVLKEIISRPDSLGKYREWIAGKAFPFDMNDHVKEIIRFYARTADA